VRRRSTGYGKSRKCGGSHIFKILFAPEAPTRPERKKPTGINYGKWRPVTFHSTYRDLCTSTMDPGLLCKIFFTIGTAVDVGGTLVPSFRQHIMNYGSRGTEKIPKTEEEAKQPKSKFANILYYIASFQVPHTWFTHYYIASVLSSIFWAVQILTHGRAFNFLASLSQQANAGGMTVNQVLLAWCFMTIQGTRRLYESITLTKPSQSKMWVGIWLLGIAFYIFMGISIWIEGICE